MRTDGFSWSLPAFLSIVLIAHPGFAARPPLLRYRFDAGQTNAYSVQIEIHDENGTNKLVGNLIVTGAVASSNTFNLALRGTLTPRRSGPMRMPHFGPSYPDRFSMPVNFGPGGCEIIVNERGKILRQTGDSPLPVPLGSVAQLFLENLPPSAESRWETSDSLTVLDGPSSVGPAVSFLQTWGAGAPYYFGQRGPAAVSVTQKIRYELKSATPAQVVISKHLVLDSELECAGEPCFSAVGGGEFVFDRNRGLIRQLDFQYDTVAGSENVTRRGSVQLNAILLEGAEREQALQPPPGYSSSGVTSAKPLTEAEIQKLADELKSDDRAVRSKAAGKLLSADVSRAPHSLVAEMENYTTDADMTVRLAAAKVIGEAATAEDIPLLVKLLKADDSSVRNSAIRGLGRLKDGRAAEPLAGMIARGGSDAFQAVEALGKIGPDAEDAALTLLKERNIETRRNACNVLKQVGTTRSIEPLRELMLDPDVGLSSAATEAIRAIKARQ